MSKILLSIIVLAFGNCQSKEYPNQDEALSIVWNEVYNQTSPTPKIVWMEELNCRFIEEGDGWKENHLCVVGETDINTWTIYIARPPNYIYSNQAHTLAHELWHLALYKMTGDADYDHIDMGFGEMYGHPFGGAVDK